MAEGDDPQAAIDAGGHELGTGVGEEARALNRLTATLSDLDLGVSHPRSARRGRTLVQENGASS